MKKLKMLQQTRSDEKCKNRLYSLKFYPVEYFEELERFERLEVFDALLTEVSPANEVSLQERISATKLRYGENSWHYKFQTENGSEDH